jgi:hypothetical protein
METRDYGYLTLRDLKSVAKYYRLEHKSRVKRVELEALIYLAEIYYDIIPELVQVDEEDGLPLMDISGS